MICRAIVPAMADGCHGMPQPGHLPLSDSSVALKYQCQGPDQEHQLQSPLHSPCPPAVADLCLPRAYPARSSDRRKHPHKAWSSPYIIGGAQPNVQFCGADSGESSSKWGQHWGRVTPPASSYRRAKAASQASASTWCPAQVGWTPSHSQYSAGARVRAWSKTSLRGSGQDLALDKELVHALDSS